MKWKLIRGKDDWYLIDPEGNTGYIGSWERAWFLLWLPQMVET